MYRKPGGLVKKMNSLMGWLAERGVGPKRMAMLDVRGRKSGQPRRTAVNWIEHEGQRYLVAPRGETEWVRNVRAAGGEASLKRGSRREKVRLEDVPAGDRAPIIQAYLQAFSMATRREFGVSPKAPIEEFERIAPDHPVFRIHPA